ncbi:MAG: DNA adenine methylase [Candidatus Hodarchaeales archaeon]
MFLEKRTTIASFPGGKSDKNKHYPLFSNIPKNIELLIEPFVGLANFFIVISPRVKTAWLNDKDPEIFALLKCIKEPELLAELIEYVISLEPVERDDYYHWKKIKPNNLIESAVKRLVILNCSPNGAGGGYSKEKAHRKWYRNKPIIWRKIHKIFKEKQIDITNMDYSEVLSEVLSAERLLKPFIYLDPPYFYVARKSSLYGHDYNVIDWLKLKRELKQLDKYHWILSNRDCLEMRSLFSEFYLLRYNTYNDMNNTLNNNPELLISNKPLFEKKRL